LKALILASGIAKRLQPLSNNIPKCLIKINGLTILDLQLTMLKQAGVDQVVITTGPHEEILEAFLTPYRKDLSITTVKNEIYDKTNYIYSIYRAKDHLREDIVLLHGDLIFGQPVMEKLIRGTGKNCAVVRLNDRPEKDFKARIEEDQILEISTTLQGENCHFLAPMYRFSKKSFKRWLDRIVQYVKKGEVHCYAENALNELLGDSINLTPITIGQDELCMEIDDLEDLEQARTLYQKYHATSATTGS
jgi:phosphoenolpyruvate phosphomutase